VWELGDQDCHWTTHSLIHFSFACYLRRQTKGRQRNFSVNIVTRNRLGFEMGQQTLPLGDLKNKNLFFFPRIVVFNI
jgi:hypothetical protein